MLLRAGSAVLAVLLAMMGVGAIMLGIALRKEFIAFVGICWLVILAVNVRLALKGEL